MSASILQALDATLDARKSESADASYVASLYSRGIDKILQKVGEEATEVVMAAKDLAYDQTPEKRTALAKEVADLWFHSLVALHHLELSSEDVLAELSARFGTSGHTEKANRTT